jgi:preprotein translocase subunit SecB
MEQNKEIKSQFVVNMYTDDTFSVDLKKPEDAPETQQDSTVSEVYQWAHLLIKEVDDQRLVERLATTIIQLLTPQAEPTVSDVISEKLAERGIKPESPEATV